MSYPSLEESHNNALKLHAIILANRDNPSLRIGVPSRANWDILAAKLKRDFRKPFFTNSKTWVRNLVLEEPLSFAYLAPHTRIELIVDEKTRHWNGWCFEVTRNPGSPVDFLAEHQGPYWLEFLFGQNSMLFKNVLENLEG